VAKPIKQKARWQRASGLFYSEADRRIPVHPWVIRYRSPKHFALSG
jgi:hypothetical protein